MKRCNFLTLLVVLIFSFKSSYGQENLTFTVNEVTFEMIFVEGGTFIMGCTAEQGSCYAGERPAHRITLTDFYMGGFQVTQELWQVVMGTSVQQQWVIHQITDRERLEKVNEAIRQMNKVGGVQVPPIHITFDPTINQGWGDLFYAEEFKEIIPLNGVGNNYPIYYINYRDCVFFCSRLTELLSDQLPEGYRFLLPTEAQWEYVARGGKMSKEYTYSGSNNIDEVAWYKANSEETTHEVGNKVKNELGIYDMSGNVWEWCRDRYNENYYSSSPATNPKGPDKGTEYVLRGGSWAQDEWGARLATRLKDDPSVYRANYGFRLVLEPLDDISNYKLSGTKSNLINNRISLGKNLTFKANDQNFEMIFVEGGVFAMGCNSDRNNIDFRPVAE